MLNLKKWVIYYDSYHSTRSVRLCSKNGSGRSLKRGSKSWFRPGNLHRLLWVQLFILYSIWRLKYKVDVPWEWNWTVQKSKKCQTLWNLSHVLWQFILINLDRSLSSPWTVHFGLQPSNLIHTKYFENFDLKIHHILI